jgi:NADPH:quinone reductase
MAIPALPLRVLLAAEIASDRVHDNIARPIEEVSERHFKVVIDRSFPLAQAAAAHAYVESRRAVGRVLPVP